jgi:hypothetical protein
MILYLLPNSPHILLLPPFSACREERLHGDDQKSKECLAHALEKHLYTRASGFEEYSDVSTLDERLRRITEALVRRRLQKQKQKTQVSPDVALRRAIGEEKHQLVHELIDEVHRLRLTRCSSCCASRMGSCPRDVPPGLPAQQVMPLPIRDLFFRTDLLDAVSSTSVERIPFVDWDVKIQQTRDVVLAYKEWIQSQTSPESALKSYSAV